MIGIGVLIYGAIAYFSPGYDDEFHNIRGFFLAREAGGGAADFLAWASSDPLHPSGSYLISFLFLSVFEDPMIARAAKAVLFVTALSFLSRRLFPLEGRWKLVLFVLVTMSPSLLMWATGLRWMAEFTICFLLGVAMDRLIDPRRPGFWIAAAGILGLLPHLHFLGLVYAPLTLMYLAARNHAALARRRVEGMVAIAIFLLLIFAPLLKAVGADASGLGHSFPKALIGAAHGILVNHGLFPLSASGMGAFGAAVGLAIITLFRRPGIFRDHLFLLSASLILASVLLGVSAHYRNIVPVLPLLFGSIIAHWAAAPPAATSSPRMLTQALLAVLLISHVWGVYNVLSHEQTVKGSWNLPVSETLAEIRAATVDCAAPWVLVWDPVLEFHIHRAGFKTGILRSDQEQPPTPYVPFSLGGAGTCVVLVETHGGSYLANGNRYFKSARALQALVKEPGASVSIKPDVHVNWKRRFGDGFPEHYVTLHLYRTPAGGMTLTEWTRTTYQ